MSNSENYISELVELSREREQLPQYVYHYTSKDIIPLIFKADALSFKLTKVSEFNDKLEGKCSDVFYDIALEELVAEKVINEEERTFLEKIQAANTGFLYEQEADGTTLFKSGPAVTYVGCFSTAYNDQYMIDEYIKNDNHEGICIRLFAKELLNWKYQIDEYGYTATVKPVLYGREVVEHLKHYIKKLIRVTGGLGDDRFERFGIGLIRGKLSSIRYMAKTGHYRQEKEYRIIVQIPISRPKGYKGHEFERVGDGILFKVPKSGLEGFDFINLNGDDFEMAKKVMIDNFYSHFLPDCE